MTVPGGFHPVVYGKIGGAIPLLIYGMYDVMPADEPAGSLLRSAPKSTTGRVGSCVINRGAVNSKEPLAGFFTTRAIKQATGRMPEPHFRDRRRRELRGRSLPKFFSMHLEGQEGRSRAFPVLWLRQAGTPGIRLGTKGLIYFEITSRGGDWGGPWAGVRQQQRLDSEPRVATHKAQAP